MSKIQQVIDSIVNGQYSQAKRQIKALTYEQRANLICALRDTDIGIAGFGFVARTIAKRDFN